MHLGTDPFELASAVGLPAAKPVTAMLDAIDMKRLPPRISAVRLDGCTLIYVGRSSTTLPDGPPSHLARALDQLRRQLVLARDAEIRSVLVALSNRPEHNPPAWAWLCPRILHDVLFLAGWSPADLIQRLGPFDPLGGTVRLVVPLTHSLAGTAGSVDLALRPVNDRLLTKVELGSRVHVTASKSSACVVKNWSIHTVTAALAKRRVEVIVDHPLFATSAYSIGSASIVSSHLRAYIDMPWSPLAPLPDDLAATFPHNPDDARSAVAWG